MLPGCVDRGQALVPDITKLWAFEIEGRKRANMQCHTLTPCASLSFTNNSPHFLRVQSLGCCVQLMNFAPLLRHSQSSDVFRVPIRLDGLSYRSLPGQCISATIIAFPPLRRFSDRRPASHSRRLKSKGSISQASSLPCRRTRGTRPSRPSARSSASWSCSARSCSQCPEPCD